MPGTCFCSSEVLTVLLSLCFDPFVSYFLTICFNSACVPLPLVPSISSVSCCWRCEPCSRGSQVPACVTRTWGLWATRVRFRPEGGALLRRGSGRRCLSLVKTRQEAGERKTGAQLSAEPSPPDTLTSALQPPHPRGRSVCGSRPLPPTPCTAFVLSAPGQTGARPRAALDGRYPSQLFTKEPRKVALPDPVPGL